MLWAGNYCLVYLILNIYIKIITKFNNCFFLKKKFIKILLIATINLTEQNTTLNLALIQWYDFKLRNQYIYGCPRLEIIKSFNFIDIEAIQDIVHIIPRFNSDNEYLVNKFIF